jgi:hypothetical protein
MVSPTSLLVPPLPRFSQRDLPKTSSGPLSGAHAFEISDIQEEKKSRAGR